MPGVIRSVNGTPLFCPRCAVVMKARRKKLLPSLGPANTMSRGSSPTSSVRRTCGGVLATSTMLTLSESWFTTHTSPLVRAATATGSRPTGTEPVCVSPSLPTLKISSRSSGVFTANSWLPSGESASGRTWPLSKVTNDAAAGAALSATASRRNERPRRITRRSINTESRAASSTFPRNAPRQASKNCQGQINHL